ncbi:VOC family protein [Jannaschia sp. CCS1]|uniref:VOC family protein n=1 Tax=Jannaschia sp. (strain CCS1) TaxID=290400 RepID=UPI000053DCA3|nr:VOC family protein [Jannaschia sp. CCS1]ABD54819.1 Glyoxalase/bleomycin resistance protein/dioxygenase [Jannaschia sp. CCS1]
MHLALVTLLVPDYDDGMAFFVAGLGWDLLSDEDQGSKRWVTVAPRPASSSSKSCALLLAVATSDSQRKAVGLQTGGRVGFFLHTNDFAHDAARITAAGGAFIEEPRHEPYGIVAQWRDPWGNLWDLIQPA